jgi:C4-type Zn-finger protein
MYIVEFTCPECNKIWTAAERVSICPYDNKVLEMEFKTISNKPKTGDTNNGN